MNHDAEIVQAALRLIERRAERRRRCRRCGNPIVRNVLKRGPAWSICSPCEAAILREASQVDIQPALIPRCLVCAALLDNRRHGVKTCSDACRNALSRIVRRHRPAPAESSRGETP